MSASDAAPLPRLGEVFFDVRGNSRSMRLSWYADTGVAVFSIWQGGTCTGTFRLPMDDLSRMIESLRRGPQGQQPGQRAARPGEDDQDVTGSRVSPATGAPDQGQPTMAMRRPGGERPGGERPGGERPGGERAEGHPEAGYPAAPGGYESGSYRRDSSGFPAYPADPGYSGDPGYPSEPGYADHPGYPADQGYPPEYPEGPVTGDYRREPPGYPAGSGTGDYGGAQGRGHRRDPGGYPDERGDYRPGQSGSHRRDPGYPAEPAGYPGGPYSHEPGPEDYPGEPAGDDSGAYPADPDYGRPAGEWDDDTADHAMGGYDLDPAAESFPYTRPPANHESRPRGRYPGRH